MSTQPRSPSRAALEITGVYALAGAAWILIVSQLPGLGSSDRGVRETAHALPGWVFVGVTSVALYFLVRHRLSQQEESRIALAESRARMEGLLDAAVDGIVTIDERGMVQSFNRAASRMFGYEAAEVIGQNVQVLMPSPYREEHDEHLATYRETGVRRIIGIGREVEGRCKDGSVFPLELAIGEVELPRGRVFTGILRDITDRRILEDRTARHEKLAAAGQLAAGVAHEIGNPLASISSVVQNLRRKVTDSQVEVKLELISTHIDRIALTVRQLVDFARPPRHEWRPVSVGEILKGVLGIVRYDERARAVDIDLEVEDDLPTVQGMDDQLTQVFLNIALNGLDALEHAGDERSPRLMVEARAADTSLGKCVQVEITDSGPGIDPAVLPHIFDPFFTTKDVGKGTGLGLAVSYRIVEQHGGRLLADGSAHPGARFTVQLPVGGAPPGDPA